MKTIGVRELKAHLSRILKDVAAGDVFLVTDRGRVVAELRTPAVMAESATAEERVLAQLAVRGVLRVAENGATRYQKSAMTSRPGVAKGLIDDDRGR